MYIILSRSQQNADIIYIQIQIISNDVNEAMREKFKFMTKLFGEQNNIHLFHTTDEIWNILPLSLEYVYD